MITYQVLVSFLHLHRVKTYSVQVEYKLTFTIVAAPQDTKGECFLLFLVPVSNGYHI